MRNINNNILVFHFWKAIFRAFLLGKMFIIRLVNLNKEKN